MVSSITYYEGHRVHAVPRSWWNLRTAEYNGSGLTWAHMGRVSALPDRLDPDKDPNYRTLISTLLLKEIEKF